MATATVIAVISAVISVGTAIYAANQNEDDQGGQAVTKQGSQNPRNKVYGKAIVGTTRVYSNVMDRDSSYRTDVLAVAGVGPLTFHNVWIEDKRMFENDRNILSNPTSSTNGTYDDSQMREAYQKSSDFKVQFRSGQENQVAANLARSNSDGEWTFDHKGALVPHIVVYADADTNQEYVIFADRYDCKALVSGEDLYDPRTDLYDGNSNNVALALRDFLTSTYYGLSIPIDYIDDDSVMHAANMCELYGLEINSAIDADAAFSDVLEDMLACMGGSLAISKGRIKVLFEDAEAVNLYDFDDTNILTNSFKVSPASSGEYANVITTTFKSGINQGKKDDFVIPADIINDPRIIQDGYTKTRTINMPYTIDAREEDDGVVSGAVKFITSREYKRSLFQTTCSFDVDLLEYPDLEIWSVVSVSNPIYEFDHKRFRVLSMSTSTDEGKLNIATVNFVEYDESIYTNDIEGSVVGGTLPIRSDIISPPTAVTFSLESYVTGGYGTLNWSAGSYTGNTAYDIEFRLVNATGTSWTRKTSQHRGSKFQFYGLKAELYDFRIRTNDRVLGTSVWIEVNNVDITVPYTLPVVSGLSIDATTNDFVLSWDDMSDVIIDNGTNPDDPESAGVTSTVADVLSHYEVSIDVDGVNQYVLTTSELSIKYTYELNKNAPNGLHRGFVGRIALVDKSGNKSALNSVATYNVQEDAPAGITVTNANGNSVIEWDPVTSRDFSGTEIHVGSTNSFTPSASTLVSTLGSESFYLYSYTLPDVTDRYVKIAHFDTFSRNELSYSPSALFSYVSPSIPVYYYIKPLTGTALKNGEGSIELEAHKVTGGSDEVISNGSVQLFSGTTGNGYTNSYTAADITNALLVTLKDGAAGSVLDSLSILDVDDGGSAIYGSVDVTGPLTWVQAPESAVGVAGAWSPSTTASKLVVTFYKDGSSVKTKTIDFTRAANGNISTGTITGDTDVAHNVVGTSTPAVSVAFTYSGITVTENLASIIGANYGATGDAGVKGAKHYYITDTSFNPTTATNFITISQGDELVTWDVITVSDAPTQFSITKYWDGNSWEDVEEIIDGNLIVNGTVRATAIDVDDLFAQNIKATGTIEGAKLIGGEIEANSIRNVADANGNTKNATFGNTIIEGEFSLSKAGQIDFTDLNPAYRDRLVQYDESAIAAGGSRTRTQSNPTNGQSTYLAQEGYTGDNKPLLSGNKTVSLSYTVVGGVSSSDPSDDQLFNPKITLSFNRKNLRTGTIDSLETRTVEGTSHSQSGVRGKLTWYTYINESDNFLKSGGVGGDDYEYYITYSAKDGGWSKTGTDGGTATLGVSEEVTSSGGVLVTSLADNGNVIATVKSGVGLEIVEGGLDIDDTRLDSTASGTLSVITPSGGYLEMGARNSSWTHIYSDKQFYFNREIYVNGHRLIRENETIANATNAANAANAANADKLGGVSSNLYLATKTDIPASADLNTYTSAGIYLQRGNSNAQSGVNYPSPRAGHLTVIGSTVGTDYISQTYERYDGNGTYVRTNYNGSWAQWRLTLSDANHPPNTSYHNTYNDGRYLGLNSTATNADKLGGVSPSESNIGNTIARRDSSGDIKARIFRPEYTSQNSTANFLMTQNETGTGDNYLRPIHISNFIANHVRNTTVANADKLGGTNAANYVTTYDVATDGDFPFKSILLTGTLIGTSYKHRVILLVPQSLVSASHQNKIVGKITASKNGGNVFDTFDVAVSSVYNNTQATFHSTGQRQGHRFVTCDYNGVKWIAIEPQFTANPYNNLWFHGQIVADLDVNNDALKVIAYKDSRSGEPITNAEINNSIAYFKGSPATTTNGFRNLNENNHSASSTTHDERYVEVSGDTMGSLKVGGSQIAASAAAFQVNGFQRTGNICLHEGGNYPTTSNKIIGNNAGNLQWNYSNVLTEASHGADSTTHDGRYGRLAGTNTWVANNTFDNGTYTTVVIKCDDGGVSKLELRGDSQGTGNLFVGQSATHGGGIEYNGDNSPVSSGSGADYITLYRRSASVDSWTARNSYGNNDWEFRGSVQSSDFRSTGIQYSTAGTDWAWRSDTGAEFMRLKSGGKLGIGTTNPMAQLEVGNSNGATIIISSNGAVGTIANKKHLNLDFTGYADNVQARIGSWDESGSTGHGYLTFTTSNSGSLSESMRIDRLGNVGIGTASIQAKLHVFDTGVTPSALFFNGGNSGSINSFSAKAGLQLISYQSDGGSPYTKTSALVANADGTVPSEMQFWTKINGSTTPLERMRIDQSGNLLVGKVVANNNTQGIRMLGGAGFTSMSRDGGEPLILNRNVNDGEVLVFRKDGLTVGSIKSRAGAVASLVLDPRGNGVGITGSSQAIIPTSESGNPTDNHVDLGSPNDRFRNVYSSGTVSSNTVGIDNASLWYVNASDRAHQRADCRDDGSFSRLHWYGASDVANTSNFRHAWYDGSSYIDVTAASGAVTFGGGISADGDMYADELTAKTLGTLSTPSTNYARFGGYGIQGNRNSFYISNSGGAVRLNHGNIHGQATKLATTSTGVDITGRLVVDEITPTVGLTRSAHNTGHLIGSYNNVGSNPTNTNPIYTIGEIYNPASTTLSNMYGIGYCSGTASFLNSGDLGTNPASWGMYVASQGTARIFLESQYGHGHFKGDIYAQNGVFRGNVSADGYMYAKSHGSGVANSKVLTYDDFLPDTPPAGLEDTISANWISAGAIQAKHLQVNGGSSVNGSKRSFKISPDAERPLSFALLNDDLSVQKDIFYVDSDGNAYLNGKLSKDTVDIESIQEDARKQINPYYAGTSPDSTKTITTSSTGGSINTSLPAVTNFGGKCNVSWKLDVSEQYFDQSSNQNWTKPVWRVRIYRNSVSGTPIQDKTYTGTVYNYYDQDAFSYQGSAQLKIEDFFYDENAPASEVYVLYVTRVSGTATSITRRLFRAHSASFNPIRMELDYTTLYYNAAGLNSGTINLSEDLRNFEFLSVTGAPNDQNIMQTKLIAVADLERDYDLSDYNYFMLFGLTSAIYWQVSPNYNWTSLTDRGEGATIFRVSGVNITEK